MKLALAMIVRGTDDEAYVLQRCLTYAAGAVDGIFITGTHSKGGEVAQSVWDVANQYGAHTSKFEWINDFAAARNFNFSQVPKEYTHILWLDADDVLKDSDTKVGMGSNLKATIEAHPGVDAYSMFYLYAFDERKNPVVVHQKTRVIKNDGCCKWQGLGLHEELVPTRQLNQFAIKGIDVVHLSDEQRLEQSRFRNYEISKDWLSKHPEDATSYFNLANAAFGVSKYDEALFNYDTFLKLSKSDDERYIARLRKVDVLQARHQFQDALEEARYAIGLKPEYPDAYHSAGKLFYHLGQYERAKDMFLNGLGRPARMYQIIVYNPRAYDYEPLMNLAKTYYALNLPQLALPALDAAVKIVPADESLKKVIRTLKKESKEGEEVVKLCAKLVKIKDKEKLRKELDKISPKYKFHPQVLLIRNTNFVKQESSGKDLVIFCGYTAEEWTPGTIAKKGSGGSEEAVITVAQGLANKGWNVTVYNNCGTEESWHGMTSICSMHRDGKEDCHICHAGRVLYKPYMGWNYRDKQDVVILWRQTKPLDWEINASKIYVDMHDVIPAGEFTESRIQKLTGIFFKSQYHRELFKNIPANKAIIIPNGINVNQFSEIEKDNNLVINTSSPVRALSALIDIVKAVRKQIPDFKMKWAYGWTTTDNGMVGEKEYPEWKAKILQGMKDAGIEDVGRLTHVQIAELYNKAGFFLYPTGFPEIDCISLTKSLAAGCWPINTDYAALNEKNKHGGDFIHWPYKDDKFSWYDMAIDSPEIKQKFIDTLVKRLKNPPTSQQRKDMREFAIKNYSWDAIINQWQEILK